MPMVTRSKRKLLNTNDDSKEHTQCPIKLMDITNSKRRRENNVIPKSKLKQEKKAMAAVLSEKNTIQLEVSSNKEAVIKSRPAENTQNASQQKSSLVVEDEIITMMRKIKKMLENNFMNVAERLQLDPVPPCLRNLTNCHASHHSKYPVKMPSNLLRQTAIDYLRAEGLYQFIHCVRHSICGHNLFPGSEILLNIFEKIMKLLPSSTSYLMNNLNTSFILTEFHSLVITILNKFPPCHIREQYLQMFKSPFKIEGIRERKPLLPSILGQLNDLIFISEKRLSETTKPKVKEVPLNYYLWEQHTSENAEFKDLPRNDQFDRLFLILDTIVRILEYDASIFIIKYSHKFASSIANDKVKPLICSVIWQDFESVIVINSMIKQLISIYVTMVALEYPVDKIQIVSRLLSLVANVINMYEYPDDTFEYPMYKNFSMDFAREIQRHCENSNYYSLNLILNVIENIRSPLIRMLLANSFLSKITGETVKTSLSVPLNCIYKRDINSFDDKPVEKEVKSSQKFPRHDSKKKVKRCVIMQRDYLRLLMIYAEALNNYYRISSAIKEIRKTAVTPVPSPAREFQVVPFNEKNFLRSIKSVDLSEKVNLREIDLHFKKMVHIRLTKETCIFYRDEMKNLLLLIKLIKCCHEKFGSKYDDWMKFVCKIEAEY